MKYDKVLWIGRDNTSLSMMAESIFVHIYEGRPVYVASRGLVVLMPMPCNPKVELVLQNHNVRLISTESKPLKEEEITDASLVLTLLESDKERLHVRYPYVKVFTLSEFVGETIPLRNPYGGTLEDYELCYTEMESMIRKVAAMVAESRKREDRLDNMFESI
mgnify:CR=1 FL=1